MSNDITPRVDWSKLPPENGWDNAIDIRQARRYLREAGDFVRRAIPNVKHLGDKDSKFLSQEECDRMIVQDLTHYVVQLRRFGIRPNTALKMLKDFFAENIHNKEITIQHLRSAVGHHYRTSKMTPPGTKSLA